MAAAGLLALTATGAAAYAAPPQVLHVLVAPEGLPPLHEAEENGPPVMRIPQFRLFDGEGQPLWAFSSMPRGFSRQLETRLEMAEPLSEGRTFRQEARFFLRRGGLPLNLTTLPGTDFTLVEYRSDRCGACTRLAKEVDRFFRKNPAVSVKILRAFIDIGEAPPLH